MTTEAAKEFFGENFIVPNLKWFNEERIVNKKVSKAKKGKKYWYYFNGYQTEFNEQFGKSSGWVLGTVVYRRNGIAFMRFEGSKDKNFETEFFDGGYETQQLIPETISCKEYKINKNLLFGFNDMDGKVKFVD